MTTLYRLIDVERVYGTRRVLSVPSLEVKEGECLGVVGPSGAGKTTLLRILAMLESPTSGTVQYSGVGINGNVPVEVRREVTMVFQRAALLDQSVYENVNYGLRIRGISDRDRVVNAMENLGIAHLADQPSHSLSGGELQRVAMARALILRPRVLLLDEPTANLDPENIAILERSIQRAMAIDGTTVVLVSHNLHQVRRLANSLAGILDGELVEHGLTEQVIEQTKDSRMRAFITGGIEF